MGICRDRRFKKPLTKLDYYEVLALSGSVEDNKGYELTNADHVALRQWCMCSPSSEQGRC